MSDKPEVKFVGHLPDLMSWEDYETADRQKRVRLRLTITGDGVEVLGDSPYPEVLDELLTGLGPRAIEQMLCG